MRILTKIFLILIFTLAFIRPQEKNTRRYHNFSGTVPISLVGVLTVGETDYKDIKIGLGAAGMVEYFFPTYSPTIYGFRFSFGGKNLKGQDNLKSPSEFKTDLIFLSGGLTAGYSFSNKVFPYVYGGVSNIWFSPKDKDGKRLVNNMNEVYPRTAIAYDAEIGTRVIFQEVLSVFISAGFHFPQTDNLDDISKGSFNDFYYTGKIGVSLSLFSKKDFDGDGIPDSEDNCPSNSEDYDGFQDADGCPDYDNDGDRIPDVRDKCPNEKEDYDGFEDDDGCPDLDNDNDGIPDNLDKCPNEPENYNGFQDDDGCPDILSNLQNLTDRDNDGIPDDIDKCPDQPETFNGFQDEDGCPDTVEAVDTSLTKTIILEGINLFDFRGADIKPTAYEELDKIAEFLIEDPFIKWSVESYTDNNGDSDSLKALAQQRAIYVVRYLIDKGLPSFMFKIFSKGSEAPIADNNTIEGRLKNNRIVLKRLN